MKYTLSGIRSPRTDLILRLYVDDYKKCYITFQDENIDAFFFCHHYPIRLVSNWIPQGESQDLHYIDIE